MLRIFFWFPNKCNVIYLCSQLRIPAQPTRFFDGIGDLRFMFNFVIRTVFHVVSGIRILISKEMIHWFELMKFYDISTKYTDSKYRCLMLFLINLIIRRMACI